jgi:hypothetical protein
VVAAVWTLIGVVIAGGVAAFTLIRGEIAGVRSELKSEIRARDARLSGLLVSIREQLSELTRVVGQIDGRLAEHLHDHATPIA